MADGTARYERGPWTYRATVPYLEVEGENTVIPGVGAFGSRSGRRGSNRLARRALTTSLLLLGLQEHPTQTWDTTHDSRAPTPRPYT